MSDDEANSIPETAIEEERHALSSDQHNEDKEEGELNSSFDHQLRESVTSNRALPEEMSSSPLSSAHQPRYSDALIRVRQTEAENFRLKIELADLQKFKHYLPKIEGKLPSEVMSWITTTMNKNAVLESDNELLKDKYDDLNRAYAELKAESEDKVENLERARVYFDSKHESELCSKNSEIAGYKNQLNDLSRQLARQEVENEELRRHIPDSALQEVDTQRLCTAEFTQNVNILTDRERELNEIKAQLSARTTEVETLQDYLRDTQAQLQEKTNEITALNRQVQDSTDPNMAEMPSRGDLSILGIGNQCINDRRSILTAADMSHAFFRVDNGANLLRLSVLSQSDDVRRTTLCRASAENLRHIVNKLFAELRGCGEFIQQLLDRLGEHEDADLTRLVVDFKNRFEESLNYAQDVVTASEANCAEALAAEQELSIVVEDLRRLTTGPRAGDTTNGRKSVTFDPSTLLGNNLSMGQLNDRNDPHAIVQQPLISEEPGNGIYPDEVVREVLYKAHDRADRLYRECEKLQAELVEVKKQSEQKCDSGECASALKLRAELEKQKVLVDQYMTISQEVQARAREASEQLVGGGAPSLINSIKTLYDKNAVLAAGNAQLTTEIEDLKKKVNEFTQKAETAAHSISSNESLPGSSKSLNDMGKIWLQLIAAQEQLKQSHQHIEQMEREKADFGHMWQEAVKNADATALEFSEKNKQLHDQLDDINQELVNKGAEIATLQKKIDEVLYDNDEYQIAHNELNTLLKHTDQQVTDAHVQIERLCDAVDELFTPIKRLFDSNHQKKLKMRQESDNAIGSNTDNLINVSDKDALSIESSEDGNRFLRIMTTKNKMAQKIAHLVERYETNIANLAKANKHVQKLQQSEAHYAKKAKNAIYQLERAQEKCELGEKNSELLESELKAYASEMERAHRDIEQLQDLVAKQEKVDKQRTSSNIHKAERLKSAEAELETFKRQLHNVNMDMDRLIQDHEKTRAELNIANKRNAELQQQIKTGSTLDANNANQDVESPLADEMTAFNAAFESLLQSASLIRRRLNAISLHAAMLRESIDNNNTRHIVGKFTTTANSGLDALNQLEKHSNSLHKVSAKFLNWNVQNISGCKHHEAIIDYLHAEINRLEQELKSMHETLVKSDMPDIREALRAQLQRITRTLHVVKSSVIRDPNMRDKEAQQQMADQPTSSSSAKDRASHRQAKRGSPLKESNK